MDLEELQSRRAAARLKVRSRRRRAGALIGLVAIAVVAFALIAQTGGPMTPSAKPKRSARSQAGAGAGAGGKASRVEATGPPGREAVPILMYHVIAAPPAGAPFPGLYVQPAEFAAQMLALKRTGWSAVTPDQLRANWERGTPLPPGRPIVVSFDNGYESQYTQALPVMRRLGWRAEENIQLTGLPPSQGGLGPREIHGLLAAGWELDTQGISHADLITLNAAELREQVAGARATLRHRYGVPVNWFCYPSGHYDATVVAAVRAAGFVGSTTVVPGWARPGDDPYRLPRLRVLGGTTPGALLSLISATRRNPVAPQSFTVG
jgi:peptidoglycan/xylan/chitin deacetylase (PgdA/CDA1 family)